MGHDENQHIVGRLQLSIVFRRKVTDEENWVTDIQVGIVNIACMMDASSANKQMFVSVQPPYGVHLCICHLWFVM